MPTTVAFLAPSIQRSQRTIHFIPETWTQRPWLVRRMLQPGCAAAPSARRRWEESAWSAGVVAPLLAGR